MTDWKLLPEWDQAREHMLNNPDLLRDVWANRLITPFESWMRGGTPRNYSYIHDRGYTAEDMHTPMCVLGNGERSEENVSIEEANLLRSMIKFDILSAFSLGFVHNPVTGESSNDLKGKMLAVSMEPLDSETGITVRDPRILGVWNNKTEQIELIEGRDLNREWYQQQKDWAEVHPSDKDSLWKWTRDGRSYLERETSGEPEKE